MKNLLKNFVALLVFGAVIFIFRERLTNQYLQVRDQLFPCKNPISYSIGTFDTRFGISKADFLLAVKQAEDIWEKPIGRNLFEVKINGNLKINLIYDDRQQVTDKLQDLGTAVGDSKASYDELSARYIALKTQYNQDKEMFTAKVSALKDRQDAYNKQVSYWNSRRGAPKAQFGALQAEKQSIQDEIVSINQMQNSLNAEVQSINTMVSTLNRLASELNLDVAKYNEVGASVGEEFEEGLYKSSSAGAQSIDIFQYDSKTKLVRLLAHEFGHALGFEHIDNRNAIMYKLNQATNLSLTLDDLLALKNHCGIK